MSGPANTRFAIAVHLLTLLANSGDEPVGSDVAAASIGANPVHVRRVVAYLRRADLVTSKAGVGGGIQLAYEPADISLTEVWDAVDNKLNGTLCSENHHLLTETLAPPSRRRTASR